MAFADQIETGARDLRLIGTMLIVLGLVLYVADRTGREKRDLESLDTTDGVSVGLAQSLALIPGVSRSGATITAGLFRGFTRESAARFSFLLSIPAVVLSGVYELKDVGHGQPTASARRSWPPCWPSSPATPRSPGCCATWSTTRELFVVYRVALGILVLTLVAAGTIEANQPARRRLPRHDLPPGMRPCFRRRRRDGDVVDDQADAGGAHRQPLEVGADRGDVVQHPLEGGGDGELPHRLGRAAPPRIAGPRRRSRSRR